MSTKTELTSAAALRIITSRVLVDHTNVGSNMTLQVTGEPNLHKGRYIINLKAHTVAQVQDAKANLEAKEYTKAANHNLTASIFADADYIPVKGEHIKALIGKYTAKDGSEKIGVTSVSAINSTSGKKADFSEFENLLDDGAVIMDSNQSNEDDLEQD